MNDIQVFKKSKIAVGWAAFQILAVLFYVLFMGWKEFVYVFSQGITSAEGPFTLENVLFFILPLLVLALAIAILLIRNSKIYFVSLVANGVLFVILSLAVLYLLGHAGFSI